jgi:fatty acid desaturase
MPLKRSRSPIGASIQMGTEQDGRPRAADIANLGSIKRSSLVDSQGRPYLEFRRTLSPRYRVAWLQLALGWMVVAAAATGLIVGNDYLGHFILKVALGLVGSVIFGFALHFLLQFQHEGAHYNLTKRRDTNDRLTNAAIGIFVGEDVRNYRRIHTGHHRYLGTTRDTERSYFDALDRRFLLQGLLGLRLIRIVSSRWKHVGGEENAQSDGPTSSYVTPTFFAAALFNGAIVITSAATGQWVLAASWVAGSLLFLPLINATRQVLEHRSETADRNTDYTKVDHGAVNRLFGDGPIAAIVGAAGFNRHLLHHWDPGVSYTRLRELERYLLDTDLGPVLVTRQSGYLATLRSLLAR